MVVSGIDHAVIAANSLRETREAFEAAGFAMTPIAEHIALKAVNTLAMFEHSYLEVAQATDNQAFGAMLNKALGVDKENLAMLAFRVDDLAQFAHASGLEVIEASRPATVPSTEGDAKFKLAWLPRDPMETVQ